MTKYWRTYVGLTDASDGYLMRVLNKRYWPHQVSVQEFTAAEQWCYANFKSGNWRNVGKTFAFKRGEDATWFKLKWQ